MLSFHVQMDPQFESDITMDAEEFVRWLEARPPSDINHYELLNGVVVMTPPAGHPHGEVGSALQVMLALFVRSRSLGKVYDSSQGFHLPSDDIVEPDHSFVSFERLKAGPPPVKGDFLRVVPDLIIEVLSKSTRSRDRGEKKAIYERNGVREYWLVDTFGLRITVFASKNGRYGKGRVYEQEERVRSVIIEGLEEDVSTLVGGGEEGVPSEP